MNSYSPKLIHTKFLSTAAFGIALVLGTSQAKSTVIYQDTFSTIGSGTLNGSAPTVASGTDGGSVANWSASPSWTLDGSVATVNLATKANAYLPFTPVVGTTYVLSLNVSVTAGSWVGFGFLTNTANITTATGSDSSGAWQTATSVAPGPVMWELFQPNAVIQAFGGIGTNNQKISTTGGSTATGTQGEQYTITIQKTDAANYTFSYAGPGISGASAAPYTVNLGSASIVGVGFGLPQGNTTGTIDNFSLTSVPEPSSALAFGLGALGLLAFRGHSRRGPA